LTQIIKKKKKKIARVTFFASLFIFVFTFSHSTSVRAERPTEQKNEDNFYENCPKLTEEQAKFLDNDLTLKELQ
jgi:hypothetical protein